MCKQLLIPMNTNETIVFQITNKLNFASKIFHFLFLAYLSNIIESCAVLMLQVLASCREKRQWVIARMCWLVPAGNQFTVIEKVGGEVNDGLVGAVVLTQHDLTRTVVWVQLVQSVQQRLLEALLLGKV